MTKSNPVMILCRPMDRGMMKDFPDCRSWPPESSPNGPQGTLPIMRQTAYWVAVGSSCDVSFYFRMYGCDESELVQLRVSFPNQASCVRYLDLIPYDINAPELVSDWGFENMGLV